MAKVIEGLKYTEEHEWISIEGDIATIGITDFAQSSLGDIVFVELPEEGAVMSAGEQCTVVESVKAASDVYIPVDGEVIAINGALEDEPELVNSDPFDGGWLFKLKPSDASQLEKLFDADAYLASLDD